MTGFRPLEERVVHPWAVWKLVEADFAAPDGETFTRTFVRSPGAVGVVPLLFDPEGVPAVVLVRQYRPPLDALMDEIPAGMRDVDGERPEETAQRELIEEVGMKAGRIELLTRFHNACGLTDADTHVFLATELEPVDHDRQGPEERAMTVHQIALTEALALVADGTITDAKTVMGLLLADQRLRQREGSVTGSGTRRTRPRADGVVPLRSVELPLAAEEFLTWLAVEKGRSRNTLAAYRRDLQAYMRWLAFRGTTFDGATEADIERWVADRRASGAAATSVARGLVAVRTFHRFCAEEGRAAHDPAAEIASPRKPAGLPKALSEPEITTLLDAVVGHEPVHRRDRAIIELLYGTGMRIGELCALSLGDIDPVAGTVRVFGKGAKERMVPLGSAARAAVGEWLTPGGRTAMEPVRWARRGDADAVFLNQRGGRLSRQAAWAVVRSYGDRVGLGDRLTPHVLRHSCATHMIEHGADIRIVQELLGHASVSTTQIYTKVTAERLRSVYQAAHPRARRR